MKKQYSLLLQNVMQFVWAFGFLLFPLFFLTFTTENFILPKQILIGLISLIGLLGMSAQGFLRRKIELRQTFLDLPVFIFIVTLIISAVFSVNRYDSFISLVPWIFLALSYLVLINLVKYQQMAFFFSLALLAGAYVLSLLTIFSFLKAYLLPFGFTHVQWFTPMGSLLDEAIYLVALLPLSLYFSYPMIKGKTDGKIIGFGFGSLILLVGIGITVYQLFFSQKPIILPFNAGFQIAFAAISQDVARAAQAFFFGSGPGTFFTDFTRFKQVSFNTNQSVWYLNFGQSSSFVLELLTTTGIVGVLGYFGIIIRAFAKPLKTLHNPLSVSLAVLIVASFMFPFSFTVVGLLFFLLGIFSALEGFKHPERSFDVEFSLIALKKNLFSNPMQETTPVSHTHHPSLFLPIVFSLFTAGVVGLLGWYSGSYMVSDILFAKSLVTAANNDGTGTYNNQRAAIGIFPYRAGYYRVFSQTNLSLANALLTSNASKGSSPSTQVQSTALSLIQQSIAVARTAVSVSPLDPLNWQNLASIYRSLINFGQNADKFAVASTQQAIVLDPANPQEYIALGGLYYQLNDFDNAARQFQIAINLKPDYTNAYYNEGHAYEAKGDLQDALSNYETVRTLVATDKNNSDKINGEIAALEKRMNTQTNTNQSKSGSNGNAAVAGAATQTTQEPLNINQSQTQLPPSPTKIPLPTVSLVPSPTTAVSPTPGK